MGRYINQQEMIPRQLPKNWKNVSNMIALSYEELRNLGWYPVIESTIKPSYDEVHEDLVETFTFTETTAVSTREVVRKRDIPTVEEFSAKKIAKIKSDCKKTILRAYPEYKQRNMIVRYSELKEITGSLSPAQLKDKNEIIVAWSFINQQRDKSNDLEQQIQTFIDDTTMTDDEKRIAINNVNF